MNNISIFLQTIFANPLALKNPKHLVGYFGCFCFQKVHQRSTVNSHFLYLYPHHMAPEPWLIKVKKTIYHGLDSVGVTPPSSKKLAIRKSQVGVLAFEISSVISKVIDLWLSSSDENIARLRGESIYLEGVRKIVSNDDGLLLGLACAELVGNLKLVAQSVSAISNKCQDLDLRSFCSLFDQFANSGHDPHNWLLGSKEMESKIKRLDSFVAALATFRRVVDELLMLENGLKKMLQSKDNGSGLKEQKIIEFHQKILWHRQEVKYLEEKSLWFKSFDTVTLLLARCVFTILARIKLVFGVDHIVTTISLPRSLSTSAIVYPSDDSASSGPLMRTKSLEGLIELSSRNLKPLPSTVGGAALSLLYANLIAVIEKMIRLPQLIGADARDALYSMLPHSIRSALRGRLKGLCFSATDPVLAAEWREALHMILRWLSPLAHNMIQWHSERSFEHEKSEPKSNVLLMQTLYFANQEKTEAAITELLVGLNYIWRLEMEMNSMH